MRRSTSQSSTRIDPRLNNMQITEFDIEGSQFFAERLRIIDLSHVVTPPHQKQQFHVENNEQHDVAEGGHHVEQVRARLSYNTITPDVIMYYMWIIVK